MIRVLVTRAAADAPALSEPLRRAGFTPVEVPLVARVAVPGAFRDVPGPFDLLVLTSAATVDVVADAGVTADRVAAVGPATAERARTRGFRVDVVPERATGQALARALGDLSGQRVLYPRAVKPTPGTARALRDAGATLVEVAAYDNVPPDGFVDAIRRAGPVDVVTLLSSSAARRLAQAGLPDGARVVVIGPSTEATAREVGLPVHAVAEPHTVEGVVEAVRRVAG